jgi:hypothetical protein
MTGDTTMDNKVTVYRFEVRDGEQRTKRWNPVMATAQTIRRLKGEADLETAVAVDKSDVDSDGYLIENSAAGMSEGRPALDAQHATSGLSAR